MCTSKKQRLKGTSKGYAGWLFGTVPEAMSWETWEVEGRLLGPGVEHRKLVFSGTRLWFGKTEMFRR